MSPHQICWRFPFRSSILKGRDGGFLPLQKEWQKESDFLHLRERDRRRRRVKTQKFPKLKNSEYRSELAKLLDPIGMLIAVTWLFCGLYAAADPRGGHQGPPRSKFFHFMQFSAKILQNNRLAHLHWELVTPPPPVNPGSATGMTIYCLLLGIQDLLLHTMCKN